MNHISNFLAFIYVPLIRNATLGNEILDINFNMVIIIQKISTIDFPLWQTELKQAASSRATVPE